MERLWATFSDHRVFLASVSFRQPHRRRAAWRPLRSNQRWTQINYIAINYKCRNVYKNAPLDSGHALACTKLSMCFDAHSKRMMQRHLDCDMPSDPTGLSVFLNGLSEELELPG